MDLYPLSAVGHRVEPGFHAPFEDEPAGRDLLETRDLTFVTGARPQRMTARPAGVARLDQDEVAGLETVGPLGGEHAVAPGDGVDGPNGHRGVGAVVVAALEVESARPPELERRVLALDDQRLPDDVQIPKLEPAAPKADRIVGPGTTEDRSNQGVAGIVLREVGVLGDLTHVERPSIPPVTSARRYVAGETGGTTPTAGTAAVARVGTARRDGSLDDAFAGRPVAHPRRRFAEAPACEPRERLSDGSRSICGHDLPEPRPGH